MEGYPQQQRLSAILNYSVLSLLAALLVGMPLAGAGVYFWSKSLFSLSVAVMCLLLLLETSLCGTPVRRKTALDKPLLGLLVYVLLIGVVHVAKPFTVESILLFLSYLALYYVAVYSIRTRFQERALLYLIVGIAVLLAVIGLLKRFSDLPLPELWLYTHQLGSNYISSTFGNRNFFAGFLGLVIPSTLALLLFKNRPFTVLITIICSSLLLVITHLLVLSRGGWLALYVSLALMALVLLLSKQFRETRKWVLISLTLMVLTVFLLISSTDFVMRILELIQVSENVDMDARVTAWSGITDMIAQYPLTGSGPGSFTQAYAHFQPPGMLVRFAYGHNGYLQLIAETGILLLPLILWLLFAFYRAAQKNINSRSRQKRGICLGAAVGCTTVFLHAMVDYSFGSSAVTILFVVMVALATNRSVAQRTATAE